MLGHIVLEHQLALLAFRVEHDQAIIVRREVLLDKNKK
jgi:hypothetical protein